ncbi:MAG: hypothetical protein JXA04_04935 [Gammaproteobacteria bacterium]|nr:hypothetical protein [Gammaproteobacteria bacterium]
MKKITLLFLLAVSTQVNTAERVVRCQVDSNGGESFSGECLFESKQNGSFHIRNADASKPMLKGISDINVYIVEKGVAEVRGLTEDGINSRWGAAHRSEIDRACWVGSDFKVCVW